MQSAHQERVVTWASALREAERSVRVLRNLAWPSSVREDFFSRDCAALPRPTYPDFDGADVVAATRKIQREAAGEDPVLRWIRNTAGAIESSARMLAAVGTPDFYEHSQALYGEPGSPLLDGKSTSLQLAQHVKELWEEVSHLDLGAPPPACRLAESVADELRAAVAGRFGSDAPEVTVVDELSANALAGPREIRVRRDACFTDRDAAQLVHHEAFVHVCTSLNGRAQGRLPILGASHARATRTQEGLAVLAEYLSGSMDPDRLRRLADRVLAIQMAIEGADFIEVFRFFETRNADREQAFENARRVFRGADLRGGAPFTKDVVYLDGLLRVTNFLRAAVAHGHIDTLLLLFVGKLDIEDLPALARLTRAGLCAPPRYLPPWIEDRRFLVSYLTYSRFLGSVDLEPILVHYRDMLEDCDATEADALG